MSSDAIPRAVAVLRGSGSGPMRGMYLLACLPFDTEALAEWLERHPDDPRTAPAVRQICKAEDALLDAYLRHAEGGD